MLSWSTEGCEVVKIENIKPGGDVFPFCVGAFLVLVEPLALIDRCGCTSVHVIGPSLDLLTTRGIFLVLVDPAEDFAIAQTLGDLFL